MININYHGTIYGQKKESVTDASSTFGIVVVTWLLVRGWATCPMGRIPGPGNPFIEFMICWVNTRSNAWLSIFLACASFVVPIFSLSLISKFSYTSFWAARGDLSQEYSQLGLPHWYFLTFLQPLPLCLMRPLIVGSFYISLVGATGLMLLYHVLTICR